MISMARTLGAPLRGAGGETGAQGIDCGEFGLEAAFDGADDVHDVRVALDEHQAVDFDGAELAYAADVVAAEVDEHHVFGALFFVVQHLVGQRLVFLLVGAARAGSGDGAVLDLALVDADQQLGRRAGQLQGLRPFSLFGGVLRLIGSAAQRTLGRKAQEEHIRAGIDGAQGAIDLEAVGLRLDVEALREDGLEDVAGGDVLLGAVDGGEEVFFCGAVLHFGSLPLRVLCAGSLGSGWARRFSSLSRRSTALS